MDIARRLVVHGLVQGVGFRYSCYHVAQSLGVAGWVRNLEDDTVEVHAEGERAAVGRLQTWCEDGPRHARVTRVDAEEAPVRGLAGFTVR